MTQIGCYLLIKMKKNLIEKLVIILPTLAENMMFFAIFAYCHDYQRDMMMKPKSLYINQEVEKISRKIKNNCLKTCEYQ